MNALQKINKRAKQLHAKHPGKSYRTLQKQAGKEYRNGSLGKVNKKHRQTGTSVKAIDKKRKAKPPGKRKTAWGTTYVERRKNRSDVPGTMAGVSSASMKSELKNRLKDKLGKKFVSRELSTKKRDKNKITKEIRTIKSELKKLD